MYRRLSTARLRAAPRHGKYMELSQSRADPGVKKGRIIWDGKCFDKAVPVAQQVRLNRSVLLQLGR